VTDIEPRDVSATVKQSDGDVTGDQDIRTTVVGTHVLRDEDMKVARTELLGRASASITTDRINTYRERLLDEGELSRGTIQKTLVLLFGVLKRAKRRGGFPATLLRTSSASP
jgi:hypothetical protein